MRLKRTIGVFAVGAVWAAAPTIRAVFVEKTYRKFGPG